MADIIILGAGLTGLSAAYHLEKQGFFNYKMFEKEDAVGGLCRTKQQDGFTFDYTGHLLHTSDPYFKTLIEQLVGMEQLNTITRRSFIYSHETYTPYPFQMNLYGLPTDVIIECITGYIERTTSNTTVSSFYAWVLEHFGAGFGKHFFFPYQEKIFDYSVHDLSSSWTSRFVPSTSLEQVLRGALTADQAPSVGYNAQFFYPKHGGIFSWVQKLADQIIQPIAHDHEVIAIDIATQHVTFKNGHRESYKQLINTIPLDRMLSLIQEPSHEQFASARNHLLCNSVINFNIGVHRPDLSNKHWIYFPETKYPFYRIGFPHNFSEHTTPPGCSSLYGEFSYLNKDQSWVHEQTAQSIRHAKQLLNLHEDEIATELIIPISHAYVIYNQWRDTNLPKLLNRLTEYNIFCAGRYAEWKYASMQEAVLDGKQIAEQLVQETAHTTDTLSSLHTPIQSPSQQEHTR